MFDKQLVESIVDRYKDVATWPDWMRGQGFTSNVEEETNRKSQLAKKPDEES